MGKNDFFTKGGEVDFEFGSTNRFEWSDGRPLEGGIAIYIM